MFFLTFHGFCNKIKKKGEKLQVGYKCIGLVFTFDQEKLPRDYILQASKIYFGPSPPIFGKLAYKFAVANIEHPASWDANKSAGPDWFGAYIKNRSV